MNIKTAYDRNGNRIARGFSIQINGNMPKDPSPADIRAYVLQYGTHRQRQALIEDLRYSIAMEYCGHETARPVLRFEGDFIGSFETWGDAFNQYFKEVNHVE